MGAHRACWSRVAAASCWVAVAACSPAREPVSRPPEAAAVKAEPGLGAALAAVGSSREASNPWSDAAREVLNGACGTCHQPGLPSSRTEALAVFDLHEQVWYQRMTQDQLRGLRRRIQGSATVVESDKSLVDAFVRRELGE